MASTVRIEIDEEVFDVTRGDRPGRYDYLWVSGPNPGYGFSSASADGRSATTADHQAAIRGFLAQVDRETGYLT